MFINYSLARKLDAICPAIKL